jgi:hypothetical protein
MSSYENRIKLQRELEKFQVEKSIIGSEAFLMIKIFKKEFLLMRFLRKHVLTST